MLFIDCRLIQDPVLYGLMVLLAVTNPTDHSDTSKPEARFNSCYHALLKKKIFATSNSSLQEDPNQVLSKVYQSFAKLMILAHMLKPFLK